MATQSVKLPLSNKTDLPLAVNFNVSRASGILEDNVSYDVFLNKFFINAGAIQNIVIDDTNIDEFFIVIGCESDSITPYKQSLFKSSDFPMYSERDLLDNINKNIAHAYMLYGQGTSPYSNIQYGPTFTFSNTVKEVGFNVSGNGSNYNFPYDFTLQLFPPQALSGSPGKCTLILKNQVSTQSVVLTTNYDPSTWGNVTFSDYGFQNGDDDSKPKSNVTLFPKTPFAALKNPTDSTWNTFGTWYLECISNRNQATTYSFSLPALFIIFQRTILGVETYRTPDATIAPYFEVSSDNYLQMRYLERWQANNFSLYLSPVLNSMLGFTSVYNSSVGGGSYKIILPTMVLSNPINASNMLLYKQTSSTVELLTDLEALYVSTTLPIVREQDVSSLEGNDTILTSFSIDQFTRTSYSFTAIADNLRKYRLVNLTNIKQFNLYMQISRKDFSITGNVIKRETLYIPPGAIATILLSFIPS